MHDDSEDADATKAATPGVDSLLARVAATDAMPSSVDVPKKAGRYEVGRRLGRGGLGIVHAGWDPQLRREAALKFVRPDRVLGEAGPALAARLRREAQVLARLEHPAVVRVFDTGEVDGQVYIAMELLAGPTLRAWAREPHPWREILSACLDAARGLSAAHRVGVVHRDFKPDNAMLDRAGRVVVVDFGLADPRQSALTSDPGSPLGDGGERLTQRGVVVGTRGYIAPELHDGGAATPASDQYAWSITARELLASGPDVPRAVVSAILLGASEDPAQRFASMDALVETLEAAQLRRGRRAVAVLGAAAGLAAAPFALAAWSDHRTATRCHAAADSVTEIWNDDVARDVRGGLRATELTRAEPTADRVLPILDARAQEWRDIALRTCLAAGGSDAQDAERASWCLGDREQDLEVLIDMLLRAHPSTVDAAVALAGSLEPARHCAEPEKLAVLPSPPSVRQRDAVREVRAEVARAGFLGREGRYPLVVELAESALRRADTLGWAPLVIDTQRRLGSGLVGIGAYADACAHYEAGHAEAERIGWIGAEADAAVLLAGVYGWQLASPDEAAHWLRVSDDALARLGHEDGFRRMQSEGARGLIATAASDFAAATRHFELSVAAAEQTLGAAHLDVATAMSNLAAVYGFAGDPERGVVLGERVLAIREAALGPDHPDVANTLLNLSTSRAKLGEHDAAAALLERAAAIRERTTGSDHAELALLLASLAIEQKHMGQHARALATAERALAILRGEFGPVHPELAKTMDILASIHASAGDLPRALELQERALAMLEETLGPDDVEVGTSFSNLGDILLASGRTNEASRAFQRALEILSATRGPDDALVAYPLLGLASARLADDAPHEALPLVERAVAIRRARPVAAAEREAAVELLERVKVAVSESR